LSDGDTDGNGICNELEATITDFDGNEYKTIKIGDQNWMAENLKTTHYNNGDEIPTGYSNSWWVQLETGAYGYYDDDPTHQVTYGNLYNWYTVDDSRDVCPDGYHVPTDEEYTILKDYLGGKLVAGGKMKEAGLDHWNSPNTGASNESGFSAFPAGYRANGNGHYYGMGNFGYFWLSSETSGINAWYRSLDYNYSDVYRYNYVKQNGFSVRCLGD